MGSLPTTSAWTSLDVAKLGVDILMPLALLVLGLWVKRFTEQLERRERYSQIEIEWRLSVFRELAPQLNNLYCFFTYQGEWQQMTPQSAIEAKRTCDRVVHMNRFLWSREFMEAYGSFIKAAFEEFRGPDAGLRLRANIERYRDLDSWRDSWLDLFVPSEKRLRREEFVKLHDALLGSAVRDLEIFKGRAA